MAQLSLAASVYTIFSGQHADVSYSESDDPGPRNAVRRKLLGRSMASQQLSGSTVNRSVPSSSHPGKIGQDQHVSRLEFPKEEPGMLKEWKSEQRAGRAAEAYAQGQTRGGTNGQKGVRSGVKCSRNGHQFGRLPLK